MERLPSEIEYEYRMDSKNAACKAGARVREAVVNVASNNQGEPARGS